MDRALLFLYAETPVHVGADASTGALDLPIQREIGTGLPIIKAESLKGALRERFRPARDQVADRERWLRIFGAEPPAAGTRSAELRPGSLRVHEAQLVAFPAPALARTFVWVTSPLARARLERKARLAGVDIAPASRSEGDDTTPSGEPSGPDCLTAGPHTGLSVLGPYSVTVSHSPELADWAAYLGQAALPDLPEHTFFKKKLATDVFGCSDDLLSAISRDCAPVAARVQLGTGEDGQAPRKTVQHGPFYSEYLPAETLLAALIECDRADDLDYLREVLDHQVLRVGGDETVGKGLMWCRVLSPRTVPDTDNAERAGAGAHR